VSPLANKFTHENYSCYVGLVERWIHKKFTVPGTPTPLHILYTGASKIVNFLECHVFMETLPRNGARVWDVVQRPYIHCVSKKTSLTFLAITRESIDGFLEYLAEMLPRKQAIICCCIFPPHLINASTLPCETENTEIVCFHVNVSC